MLSSNQHQMKGNQMQSTLDKNLVLVCQFCDVAVNNIFCYQCGEYKGIMTMAEWETLVGEMWEV